MEIKNKKDMLKIIENTNNKNYDDDFNLYTYIEDYIENYEDLEFFYKMEINTKIENNNYLYEIKIKSNYKMQVNINNLKGKEKIKATSVLNINTNYNKYNSDIFILFQNLYDVVKNDILQKLKEYKIECSINMEYN